MPPLPDDKNLLQPLSAYPQLATAVQSAMTAPSYVKRRLVIGKSYCLLVLYLSCVVLACALAPWWCPHQAQDFFSRISGAGL